MGSLIHLFVGSLEIDWGKNNGSNDHSALFQPGDLIKVPYWHVDEKSLIDEDDIVSLERGYRMRADFDDGLAGAPPEAYPVMPDERYFVVRGRLWRCTNPALPPETKVRLTKQLMDARRLIASSSARAGGGRRAASGPGQGRSRHSARFLCAPHHAVMGLIPNSTWPKRLLMETHLGTGTE